MTQKAFAKINTFLKITATRGNYHEMVSRFIQIPHLFDTLTFTHTHHNTPFDLQGDFGCTLEDNTIFKAYQALQKSVQSKALQEFVQTHTLHVEKNIPSFAGLGGGSSDAATFLRMVNELCALKLDTKTLADISSSVGADIPFFIYNYPSANVEGIGEIITPFEEDIPKYEIFTPQDVQCGTVPVFQEYRKNYLNPISSKYHQKLLSITSLEVYETMNTQESNDLYTPALALYPKLANYNTNNYRFSGSGSSFFRIQNG